MLEGRISVRHATRADDRRGRLGGCRVRLPWRVLVDQEGNVTVKSDATKQVLEWFKKVVPFLPADVFAWDDASNSCVARGVGAGAQAIEATEPDRSLAIGCVNAALSGERF